ncbi:MAG: iron ABC transporter permease [Muribaculaceae bacterium]|nr:iron ABC transporter permease [Muribaculaceae bacterium]
MRQSVSYTIIGSITILLFMACMVTGAVDIPIPDVFGALLGGGCDNAIYETIIMESRLPMALTALLCGIALSVSGLMLQTTFSNPLAGPSILGVSTGASLGVALIMLSYGSWLQLSSVGGQVGTMVGAIVGAGIIILILIALSAAVRSATMLLIAGIMIGYLASAIISWLNFFAPSEEVKGYAIWGMGSFMGVTLREIPLFSLIIILLCGGAICMAKPLNALLAGDKYAASLGYNPRRTRTWILLYSGALTAVATAYCGPVGFIGLAVPHIARVVFATSHHNVLLPATMLCGACVGLACAWLCVLPSSIGILPLSAVTPIIGIPVILYVILRRKKLYYFN